MHFLSSRGLKIWVGIALLKKKEMYLSLIHISEPTRPY